MHMPESFLDHYRVAASGDEICRTIASVARVVYQSARTWAPGCGPETPAGRSNVLRRGMVTALQPNGTAMFEACPS